MTRILGISGSLRKNSLNTALLRAAQELAPPDVRIELATLHGIPLYDGDLEDRDGLPKAVEELKERIATANGVILATPEYNNSLPGVFKNAMDWLSRPGSDIPRVFHDRPFAVIGATPGGFGTTLAQTAWLPVLRTLRVRHWTRGRLMLSGASKLFDEQGKLADQKTREALAEFLSDFAAFAANAFNAAPRCPSS